MRKSFVDSLEHSQKTRLAESILLLDAIGFFDEEIQQARAEFLPRTAGLSDAEVVADFRATQGRIEAFESLRTLAKNVDTNLNLDLGDSINAIF